MCAPGRLAETAGTDLVPSLKPSICFLISILLCILVIQALFNGLIPWYCTILAVVLSLLVAAVGIRSISEIDYNPESALGIMLSIPPHVIF